MAKIRDGEIPDGEVISMAEQAMEVLIGNFDKPPEDLNSVLALVGSVASIFKGVEIDWQAVLRLARAAEKV